MKKHNICLFTYSDFPYGGAPENFIRQIALGLTANNAEVEVIRFKGGKYQENNDTQIKCSNYIFKNLLGNNLLLLVELFLQIIYIPFFLLFRKFIKNDNAIILYGIDRVYFLIPFMFFCKLFKIKCVRIIAEIFPDNLIGFSWWRKPVSFFYKAQLKYVDRFLDGIIVLSFYLRNLCLNNNVKSENILLIPHFIDVEVQSFVTTKTNEFRIGFCGLATIENGILDLLEAFILFSKRNINSNVQMIILGDVSSDIMLLIEKNNLASENVIFKGFLNKTDVLTNLNACNVLVNPRKSGLLADSGFPTKLGEYFALKKPVVSTKVGDINLYFTDKVELILAEPDNPYSLAESLDYVFKNQNDSVLIGENGYKWAKENLEYKSNTKKLINFIFK